MKFNRLGIENGLSQNSVLAVCQDKDGFIWLGTRSGLNKYDSNVFKVYRNLSGDRGSLYNSYITALSCDKNNQLWIGTTGGLNLYNRILDKFIRIELPYKPVNDVNRKRINSLLIDRSSKLWVASEFNLNIVSRVEGKTKIVAVPLPPGKIMLRSLFQDHAGVMWVGTTNGIYQIFEKSNRFHVTKLELNTPTDLSNVQIMSITEDDSHHIWIGTSGKGLLKYNTVMRTTLRYTANSSKLSDDNIRRLLFDKKAHLWIGTQNGVSVLNTATNAFSTYRNNPWDNLSLSQNSVHSLFKDNAGTVWIGTFFGGVNCVYPHAAPFTVLSNRSFTSALKNNVISSVIEDIHGNLWIGTEGGGVNVKEAATGKIRIYQHDPNKPNSLGSNLVKVIHKDRYNHIWVGTHGGGLNLYNAPTDDFVHYLNDKQATLGSEITCIMQDRHNRLWIGTETAGLNVFEKKGEMLVPVNAVITRLTESRSILSVIQANDGRILAGGPDGLYIIANNEHVKVLKKLTANQPLSVNCIYEYANGDIWVGTNASGLAHFSKDFRLLSRFTVSNGLSDNKVLGILHHKNELWISTGNGLNRLNLKTNKINHYSETDGLAGNVFNNNSYYRAGNGQMFFGGYNGLNCFYPDSINLNLQVPVTQFTSLSVHNQLIFTGAADNILQQNINLTRQINLNYNQNVFTLQFAVLNYIKSQKNHYQYYLEGYDKSWQNVDIPSATYTNVPPGDYLFHVRGSNNDNIWSKKAVLKINIRPPFWRTWWAYLFYFIFATGLIILIIRYLFIRALYKKEQDLTRLKLNFFTNISHEIRTHLALIIGPADKLISDNKSLINGKQQLITIRNNSQSLLQLINELLDFRKAETGHLSLHATPQNIVDFIKTISISFEEIAVEKHIKFELQFTIEHIEISFDREQLEKVFYNLLHNAFKFTPNGGSVTIQICNQSDAVGIDIINSGPGISKENINRLFDNYFQDIEYGKQNTGYGIGLALSKSIVERHKGSISVTTVALGAAQNLTTFTVVLKKGSKHFLPKELQVEKAINNTAARLPAVTVKLTNEDNAIDKPLHVSEHSSKEETPTVLIVEDNFEIRKFIKETLQTKYNIAEAQNGIEGFELATYGIPDLIISDVMMPEMDGLAFCAKIKSDERSSHIPVILLTAQNSVQHHMNGLQTGADIYLTKPFSVDILTLQVDNLLRAREQIWAQFGRRLENKAETTSVTEGPQPDNRTAKLHPLDEAFINRITSLINENLVNRNFGVQLLSEMAGMSQPVLFRKIKGITGLSANDFVKSLRLKRAAELLLENHYNVSEISTIIGYESSKYFSREFKKYYGATPSEYANEQQAN